MLNYNLKLNNFFGTTIAPLQMPINNNFLSERKFSITRSGKFHEICPVCPCCGSMSIIHNGNDKCKSKLIKELGLEVKRGKFECKKCGKTWTTRCEDIESFVKQYKQLIAAAVFNLCCNEVSLDKISEHISIIFGKNISHEWVRQLYLNAARTIEQKKALSSSGIFNYDEQYIEVNGKVKARIVVIDAVLKDVIFDETVEDSKIETLKDKLNMKMLPYKKEAFVVDLARGYPKMLMDIFPNVKIQWCIFHLNKIILHDFEHCKKKSIYGNKVLPLQELYYQYLLLNLFFNHEAELQFLRRQIIKLTERKDLLKRCKCYEGSGIISRYELQLISEFSEYRRSLKKNRRKNKFKFLLRQSQEETLNLLAELERRVSIFPKNIQERIKKIRKNLGNLTLFQENPLVPPTNNNIEQYYSVTLQKTEKKRFRSKESIELKLKIVREKWNQTLQKLKFNFLEFLRLFAKISFLFAPT